MEIDACAQDTPLLFGICLKETMNRSKRNCQSRPVSYLFIYFQHQFVIENVPRRGPLNGVCGEDQDTRYADLQVEELEFHRKTFTMRFQSLAATKPLKNETKKKEFGKSDVKSTPKI